MAIVTLGILARVDAGKTSLTDPLHLESNVILAVGRVGKGTTRTDKRRLARAIRAARLPLLVFVHEIDRLGARGEARSFPCTGFGR